MKTTNLGPAIRKQRVASGLDLTAAATACGHSPEWLSMIERELRNVNINELPRIAQVIGLEPAYLVMVGMFNYHPKAYAALLDYYQARVVEGINNVVAQHRELSQQDVSLLTRAARVIEGITGTATPAGEPKVVEPSTASPLDERTLEAASLLQSMDQDDYEAITHLIRKVAASRRTQFRVVGGRGKRSKKELTARAG